MWPLCVVIVFCRLLFQGSDLSLLMLFTTTFPVKYIALFENILVYLMTAESDCDHGCSLCRTYQSIDNCGTHESSRGHALVVYSLGFTGTTCAFWRRFVTGLKAQKYCGLLLCTKWNRADQTVDTIASTVVSPMYIVSFVRWV